ncbi:piggyBac transposable element-derived protein 4-like [Hippocampus comes]|uniref:piggyBac transposable element-derived protein 4-like n=1 Tax=Hippocampus comes TaxID=109280 RepID=UPI00094E27DA|nr:PREDICTED: piggyBac transposable element-derived protein 4-like [Hippocampus comes]
MFAFTKTMALVSYVPKKGKNVVLLSTKHREPQLEEGPQKKPNIILAYNKSKGAVDHLDQACSAYTTQRRTPRWPMCLFYHILDISLFNAFVLFVAINPKWNEKNYLKGGFS